MPPVINPVYPIAGIGSVDELLAIAVGMEREAAERYEQLAAAMARSGQVELAAVFRELGAIERDHESGIGRWAAREGRQPPEAARFSWRLPETYDSDTDESWAGALTPYEALGVAVRNEERAFAFYSYLAALAGDGAVQSHAESLAREELKHVAQLRVLRRQAFHRARPAPQAGRAVTTLAQLRSLESALSTGSCRLDILAADALEVEGDRAAAAVLRQRAGAMADGGRPATRAAEGARDAGLDRPGALTASGALQLALRDAEQVAEAYLTTADHAGDQALMDEAQRLAEEAVGRLALLRSMIEERQREDLP